MINIKRYELQYNSNYLEGASVFIFKLDQLALNGGYLVPIQDLEATFLHLNPLKF